MSGTHLINLLLCFIPLINLLLTTHMAAVLSKLDALLGKVNKIYGISRNVADIKIEVATIREDLSELETRVDNIECRLPSVEARVDSAPPPHDLESTIAEFNERTRRSRNVMVYNLDESLEVDVKSKKHHNLALVNRSFLPLLPSFTPSGIKTIRVRGNQSKQPCPLKVVLNNQSDVMIVMSGFLSDFTSQVDACFSSLKLSKDRTPHEAKHLRSLNAELKERTTCGETDLTFKFLNNIPHFSTRMTELVQASVKGTTGPLN